MLTNDWQHTLFFLHLNFGTRKWVKSFQESG